MPNDGTIHDRIEELVNTFAKGKNTIFASMIGTSEGNIRGYIKGVLPKQDILEKIVRSLEINSDWLLTGRGDMLKNSVTTHKKLPPQVSPDLLPEINREYKGTPYYNVDFIGGFDVVLNDQTQIPDYYIDFVPYNKPGVVWCNITGHSMEPELNNGDFIAMKEMTTPIEYLPYGEIYGIVTDDFRTVKRIRMSEKKGYVRLIPTNKSPEYAEQEIPVTMIRKVFAVLGSMHRLF